MKTRALLVEDDSRLVDSVVTYLDLKEIDCDYCTNGQQAINLIMENSYDVIISDVNMPKISGFELCKSLRDLAINTPLILVTSRAQLNDKVEGFDAGADDYLVKPFELKELEIRISALLKRKQGQSGIINIEQLELTVDTNQHQVIREGVVLDLSKSNWSLLLTLARAWPNPVSKQDLEHALWSDNPPDSNGLKVHIHNLRKRVDKPFTTQIVHSVPYFGFVLKKDDATI